MISVLPALFSLTNDIFGARTSDLFFTVRLFHNSGRSITFALLCLDTFFSHESITFLSLCRSKISYNTMLYNPRGQMERDIKMRKKLSQIRFASLL